MAEFKLSPHAYTTGLYNNKLNQKFSELIKITHKYVYHAPSYAKYSTCKHLILLTWQLHDLIVECNLKIKHYIRYVDDMVFIGLSQQECYFLLNLCIEFLNDNLGLTLSKWKIQSLHRSINFCGYRTNRYYRVIRKRSLNTFNNGLKYHDYDTIESVLAHAEHSASYNFFMKKLKPLHDFLPKHLKRRIYKWQSIHSSPLRELTGTA